MNIVRVGFAGENVAPIVAGDKWLTARLGWEATLAAGDVAELYDEEREAKIGDALVSWKAQISARAFVETRADGHKKYDDVDEFAEHMAKYYPDRDVHAGTTVDVIRWDPDCVILDEDHPLVPEWGIA